MTAHCLSLRDLGQNTIWRLLEETRQTQEHTTLLAGCRALQLSAANGSKELEQELSWRASLLTHGGSIHAVASEQWLQSMDALVMQMPLYAAYADILLVRQLEQRLLQVFAANSPIPVINAGNAAGDPAAALADLALIHESKDDLSELRIAWVGGFNGLAHSLIEAAMYVPFELFMAVPEWSDPEHGLLDLALRAGAKIFLTREPHLVLDGAHVIYCGVGPVTEEHQPLRAGMRLTAESVALSCPGAKLLTAETLSPACRADESLLEAAMPLWTQRLRIRQIMQALLIRHLRTV